jgi:hypothetical protein
MSSSSSSSSQHQGGLTVDWEMKALLIVSVYAMLKFLGSLSFLSSTVLLSIARGVFLFGHIGFVKMFMDTNTHIKTSEMMNLDQKVKAKNRIQAVFRNVIMRGGIITLLHGRTLMLPPLIISVAMGFFTMIEDRDFYHLIYSKNPKLFGLVFAVGN